MLYGADTRRRALLAVLGCVAAAWTVSVSAPRAARMRRIGFLMGYPEDDPKNRANLEAFHEGLKGVGLEEGRNVQIDYRWAGVDANRTRALAKELIALNPDVILASTNQVVSILMNETRTIPIVFVYIGDPIGSRYAATLARPGGNLTGFANFEAPIGGKWLEMLKELSPQTKRVGFVYHPAASPHVEFLHAAEASAPSMELALTPIPVTSVAEIERLITGFANAGANGGIVVAPHALTLGSHSLIAKLATRHALPGVYGDRIFALSGGLLAFGINMSDQLRRSATYINAILKGERPGELPVQLPTKYEVVLNLKTARALGVTVPPTLLARADEVIE